MKELLAKVLTDKSARRPAVLKQHAAQNAELGYGWAGVSDS